MAGIAYWILINSVLEEYVYRWFIYSKCEAAVPPVLAVLASALWLSAASIGVHLGGWEVVGLLTANFVAFAVPSSSSGSVGIYEFTGKTMMMMLFV